MSNLMEDVLKDFLFNEFGLESVTSQERLFSSRLLRSIDAMRLIFFIQKQFDIQLTNSKLRLADIDTVELMMNLITDKQGKHKNV